MEQETSANGIHSAKITKAVISADKEIVVKLTDDTIQKGVDPIKNLNEG